MRCFLALILLALFAATASAQDAAPIQTLTVVESVRSVGTVLPGDVAATPFNDDSVRPVVSGGNRLTQKIILVLDVSGSMKNENRIGRVLQLVRHVMEQPSDDLEVAVITFSSMTERWHGVPEPEADPPVPYGWARLPSATALALAQSWVLTRASSGTDPCPALKQAITEARKDVSVVFVTDGEFDGASCVKAYRDAQKERVEAGRHEVPLLVYGVGSGVEKLEHMATIGREGGVGFWVDKVSAKSDDKTDKPRRTFR